jgi:hypothetical protein
LSVLPTLFWVLNQFLSSKFKKKTVIIEIKYCEWISAKLSMAKVTLPVICHPRYLFALLLPRAGPVFSDRSYVLEVFIGILKKKIESLGLHESLVRQNILQRVVMSVSEVEGHLFLAVHAGCSIHYILLHTSCGLLSNKILRFAGHGGKEA